MTRSEHLANVEHMVTHGQCAHGWRREDLEANLQRELNILEDYKRSVHPFRAAMIEGQQKRIATLRGHLAEIKGGNL